MVAGPFESLDATIEEGVVQLTIDRPEVHNALNDQVMLDLSRAFDQIALDRSIDAVVIEGAGEAAFSAGADIEEYAGEVDEHDHQRDRQALFYDVYRKSRQCHAPVIAKIDGYCVGGGLIVAMYCDIRFAAEGSEFALPVTDVGQVPTGGASRRAIDLVGEAAAKELVLTAGYIDAAEAERIGLVNRAVPADALEDEVKNIVSAIRETASNAVKNSKRTLNEAADAATAEAARKREADRWWEQFATEERRERVAEFVE